jgi:hypothetical protein
MFSLSIVHNPMPSGCIPATCFIQLEGPGEAGAEMKRTKTRYFLTVMMIYLGIFLVGLFLIMLFFTIFSIHPYLTLAAVAVLLIADVFATRRIVTQQVDGRYLQ